MSKRNKVAPGCYFEPEEQRQDTRQDSIGKKRIGGHMPEEPAVYRRRSELESIPDNFLQRMMSNRNRITPATPERNIITPTGFAVSIAYNKGSYQLVPKEDL